MFILHSNLHFEKKEHAHAHEKLKVQFIKEKLFKFFPIFGYILKKKLGN